MTQMNNSYVTKRSDRYIMSSKELKALVMHYWLYVLKTAELITTEMKFMDLCIITNKEEVIEVETKICESDFKVDFTKPKHLRYNGGHGEEVPDYFYFAVPENLHIKAEAYLKQNYPNYGLVVYTMPEELMEHSDYHRVLKVINAKKLQYKTPINKREIFERASRELAGLHGKLYFNKPLENKTTLNNLKKNVPVANPLAALLDD